MKRHKHYTQAVSADDGRRDLDRSENEGFSVMYSPEKPGRLKAARK
jgi:hypothetical protein